MLEAIVEFLMTVPWYWVLIIAFAVTVLENLFPPSPCDSVLVFMGSMVALGIVGFAELLFFATLGSTVGFILMYQFGAKFDNKILKSGKFKFLKAENVDKVENWFRIYGYKLIVANRFLSGTRAVISFFAGMSGLNFRKTIILSAISAAIWNSILLLLGSVFGSNWQALEHYISVYGQIIFPIVIIAILFFFVRWLLKNKKKQTKSNPNLEELS